MTASDDRGGLRERIALALYAAWMDGNSYQRLAAWDAKQHAKDFAAQAVDDLALSAPEAPTAPPPDKDDAFMYRWECPQCGYLAESILRRATHKCAPVESSSA